MNCEIKTPLADEDGILLLMNGSLWYGSWIYFFKHWQHTLQIPIILIDLILYYNRAPLDKGDIWSRGTIGCFCLRLNDPVVLCVSCMTTNAPLCITFCLLMHGAIYNKLNYKVIRFILRRRQYWSSREWDKNMSCHNLNIPPLPSDSKIHVRSFKSF